jgi:hypothetical protein
MLLQHKIAKQSDHLLQLSQRPDQSPNEHDHADCAQSGQTDITESTLPQLHVEL